MERLARAVFDRRTAGEKVDRRTAKKVAAAISQAVYSGYGQPYAAAGWNTPDWEMIRNLQRSVYQFSFAKNHEQLKATTRALYDNEGRVVPFPEFRQIAARIGNTYNVNYLSTEYNTAIGSAQMASRWVEFSADREDFPNVTYRTVGDEQVRQSHRLLDGVTLPLTDSFWDTWWPPNGWGCRCDMEQATAPVTRKDRIATPDDAPPMFRTNMAKDGIVFPKDHPYYTHMPEDVARLADGNNPFLYERIHKGKRGGFVYDNPLHRHGEDWEEELKTAKILADSGEKVVLLPVLPADEQWQRDIRKLIMPAEVRNGKNPDATLEDGRLLELKVTKANTANSIDTLLRKGKDQADIVCIRLTGKMPEKALKSAIKGRVKRTEIREVWILKAGAEKPVKYTREQIEKF